MEITPRRAPQRNINKTVYGISIISKLLHTMWVRFNYPRVSKKEKTKNCNCYKKLQSTIDLFLGKCCIPACTSGSVLYRIIKGKTCEG
jgi:integral membrane sensor domain MASE1